MQMLNLEIWGILMQEILRIVDYYYYYYYFLLINSEEARL